jgi:hypothetical protein
MSQPPSRPWMGYLAGASLALFATAGVTAHAQTAVAAQSQANADAARADSDAARAEDRREHAEHRMEHADHQMERHEERRIMIMHDGEGHHHMDQAEHLRTMLQLKPGQEAALTAYLAAVKPAEHMHDHIVEMSSRDGAMVYREHDGPGGAHDMAAKSTPERLADMEKRMADSQAEARKRIDATRKFYSQLEPSQKKVFDEMPMLMIGPIGPIGPMMLPGPMKVRFERPPMPPMPPMPPVPPTPPAPPRS